MKGLKEAWQIINSFQTIISLLSAGWCLLPAVYCLSNVACLLCFVPVVFFLILNYLSTDCCGHLLSAIFALLHAGCCSLSVVRVLFSVISCLYSVCCCACCLNIVLCLCVIAYCILSVVAVACCLLTILCTRHLDQYWQRLCLHEQ